MQQTELILRTLVNGVLKRRTWASYHDRVSGLIKAEHIGHTETPTEFSRALSNAQIAALYSGRAELLDHLTGKLQMQSKCWYWQWQVHPGQHHLMEGCLSE